MMKEGKAFFSKIKFRKSLITKCFKSWVLNICMLYVVFMVLNVYPIKQPLLMNQMFVCRSYSMTKGRALRVISKSDG